MTSPLMVVAIGGNALIKDKQHQSVPDQMAALEETSHHLGRARRGRLAHGDRPRQRPAGRVHPAALRARRPRAPRGAARRLRRRHAGRDRLRAPAGARARLRPARARPAGRHRRDPGRGRRRTTRPSPHPTKPIGSFLDDETAARRQADGWTVVEDAGRGKRVVVASPEPDADRRAAGRQGARRRRLRRHHGRRRRDPGRRATPPGSCTACPR